ncbi:methyl-accepting chemotaxis protein [Tropicimonas aquimaris]|uniref:Methyl-accepting chemotaxis protein n=1 Tax=Tropicimonas aquimaris TaxID=914152 RepID=A0ABW3ITC1_9RHOB
MRILDNVRLSVKLPLIVALLSAVAISLTAALGWLDMRRQSVEQSRFALELATHARAAEIEAFFADTILDVRMQAGLPTTAQAAMGLGLGFHYIDDADPVATVRRLYLEENPYPSGARERLIDAGDGSEYSRKHAAFHDQFLKYVTLHGLRDSYLIDPEGFVVYSVRKADEFGMNVVTSPAAAGLGEVFDAAMAADPGQVVLSDFRYFEPAGDAPVGFTAAKVVGPQDTLLGVLVTQVSLEPVNAIMQSDLGLPERTETYLVGPDGVLRSDSRLVASAMALRTSAEGPAVAEALAGKTDVVEQSTFSGEPSLAAFRPVEVSGTLWAIVAEEPIDVLFQSSRAYLGNVAMKTAGLLALISLIGWLLSHGISRPLRRVEAVMGQVRDGQLECAVPDVARKDEVGAITRSLEDFRKALLVARDVSLDAQAKSAALTASSAPVMMLGRDYRIGFVNEALVRMMEEHAEPMRETYPEFDPLNLVGQTIEVFHPDPDRLRGILDDPEALPCTINMRVSDVRFSLVINAIRGDDGGYIGNVVEWQDVTESQLQQAILDTIEEHMVTAQIDPDGRILRVNGNFSDGVGVQEPSLIGKNGLSLIRSEHDSDVSGDAVLERLGRGEPVAGRFRLISGEGATRWIEGGFNPVLDMDGAPMRHLFMGTDTTGSAEEIARAEAVRSRMEAAQARVVEELKVGLDELADGNLTVEIEDPFDPEYDRLRRDFNASVSRLREAMSRVVTNAGAIRSEADEINAAAEDLSRRTERQAATLEETAAALDELTTSVRGAADGAALADKVVEDARADAERSGSIVEQAVDAMGEIATSSQQISKIVGVIDDIAFQTNLLALNAGVEAARAGEAGRGFAVVASEVRALAQRSSEAAREINDLITSSGDTVERGVELVGQTGTALKRIVESVKGISGHVSEIAVSAREQSTGLLEINAAVNQLDQVTQQNAAMFEQTTATSNALTREAEALAETMMGFRTGIELHVQAKALHSNSMVPEAATRVPPPARLAIASGSTMRAARVDPDDDWEEF